MPAVGISGINDGPSLITDQVSPWDIGDFVTLASALLKVEHLFFHLFAGIDGASTALDHLGSRDDPRVLHLWFEVDPFCQSFLRRRASPCHRLVTIKDRQELSSSVFSLVQFSDRFIQAVKSASQLRSVTCIAGSPCVGFSMANPRGRGIDDPESEKMWVLLVWVSRLRVAVPCIHHLMILENVVPRQAQSKRDISSALHMEPILTEARLVSPCRRARYIWSNLDLSDLSFWRISWQDCVDPEWVPASVFMAAESPVGENPIFGTFLRPFPPGRPSEYPASFHRLPLSSYDESGLVVLRGIKEEDSALLRASLQEVRSSSGDPRDSKSSSFRARRDLCEWIHLRGAINFVRPLSAAERFRSLGFPADGVPGHESSIQTQLPFLMASGNTFSVPIFVGLLRPLHHMLQSGSVPPHSRIEFFYDDRASALRALGSSGSSNSRHQRHPPTLVER